MCGGWKTVFQVVSSGTAWAIDAENPDRNNHLVTSPHKRTECNYLHLSFFFFLLLIYFFALEEDIKYIFFHHTPTSEEQGELLELGTHQLNQLNWTLNTRICGTRRPWFRRPRSAAGAALIDFFWHCCCWSDARCASPEPWFLVRVDAVLQLQVLFIRFGTKK